MKQIRHDPARGAQNVTPQARGEVQKATAHVLEEEAQNVTAQNITGSEVVLRENAQEGIPGILEDTAQRNTTSDVGPKNYLFADEENDSSLSTSIGDAKLLDGLLASTFDKGSCLSRMLTLTSAFLYAVLTDRILLVRFGTDMLGLFCEPFPDSSWLLPKNFLYWKNWKHVETYENFRKNDIANTYKGFLPSFLVLNLQHSHGGKENFFHCENSQDLLQKVTVLILTSDQYFAPSLFMIP
ncbi:hypothetical protein L6164_021673 [Bauhinia variegata]|uniref:Uncharacterized protein n=1 Tax=Bauhinia variegata TaxID=167791 RepID=A0ACB9MZL2_BAUVA|nr:hypothetical protein L6164_021673 [Bauhinia variegata]